jgi:hypothetical protein
MTLKPPRVGEIVAGACGFLLVFSLLLPWYRTESGEAVSTSGFEAFSALDVFLALVAASGMGLLVAEVTQPTAAVPVAWSAIAALLALLALALVLWRTLDPPIDGTEPVFALLGLLATAGIAAGCLVSMRDERPPTGAAEPPRPDPPTLPVPEVGTAGSEGRR